MLWMVVVTQMVMNKSNWLKGWKLVIVYEFFFFFFDSRFTSESCMKEILSRRMSETIYAVSWLDERSSKKKKWASLQDEIDC